MTIQNAIMYLYMTLFSKFAFIKIPVVFTTIWIILFGFFCAGMFHTMPVDTHAVNSTTISEQSMSGCCGMSLSGHLDVWKSTFLSTTRDQGSLLLTLVITLVVALVLWKPPTQILSSDALNIRFRSYVRHHPNLKTFSALQLAFSNGILNPKLY